ncbi:MAG: MSMEG_1061 family FMN-dependent PPOX-type flavoprotein [Pseudomonadota bacterium]
MNDMSNGRFSDVVTDAEELRGIVGEIYPAAVTKVIDHLDEFCVDFIQHAPFFVIGSGGGERDVDVSPKGDPAGFVKVLDDKTLAIPDRPGNARMDTFLNVLDNPRVSMIFLVPGRKDTLRVIGKAQIVRDEALRRSMIEQGKVPELAMVVHVERAFFHCAKCMVRSSLWDPKGWPDKSGMQSLGAALVAHSKLKETAQKVDEVLEEDEREGLY